MYNQIENYGYLEYLEPVEVIGYILFALFVLVLAFRIKNKNIEKHTEYKYFVWGILVKILGGAAFCWVYTYYYRGGDTISYWESARAFSNLLWENPSDFFKVYFGTNSQENYYYFTSNTGYPWDYMYYDNRTILVIKIVTPFVFLASNSYLLSTLMLSVVSYFGIWRMYVLFCRYYPQLKFELALAILFLPSVFFWGSGILKDTITLSATCWFITSFYFLVIAKEKRMTNIFALFISFLIIFSIKPYILFALIPGSIIWFFYGSITTIRLKFLRYAMIPLILIGSSFVGYYVLTLVTDFSIDDLLEEAVVKQLDLKREEYQGNSFDIGEYEPTIEGALSVAPAATIAGLFRPFLWESKSAATLLSGLENFVILLLFIIIVIRSYLIRFFVLLFNHPLVLFCFLYTFLFSLIVGLSTSNFGALVRFKIAFLPMFLSGLVVLNAFSGKRKKFLKQIEKGLSVESK